MLAPIDARWQAIFEDCRFTARTGGLNLIRPDLDLAFAPGTFYIFWHRILDRRAAGAELVV